MEGKRPVLARDEAAALAVFDPQDRRTLAEIQALAEQAKELAPGAPIDQRFAPILAIGGGRSRVGPWTRPPRYADRVLVLRLRQVPQGNAAPQVRETAAGSGLAVLDLLTNLVFASPDIQAGFDSPSWRGSEPAPPGMHAGSFLQHSTFGEGRVLDIGVYEGRRAFMVRFADRLRLLDMEYGLPHVRLSR